MFVWSRPVCADNQLSIQLCRWWWSFTLTRGLWIIRPASLQTDEWTTNKSRRALDPVRRPCDWHRHSCTPVLSVLSSYIRACGGDCCQLSNRLTRHHCCKLHICMVPASSASVVCKRWCENYLPLGREVWIWLINDKVSLSGNLAQVFPTLWASLIIYIWYLNN